MKEKQQKLARALRSKGVSLREISEKLGCSKSSISVWVRGMVLSPQQIACLRSNQDKGRAKAAQHPNSVKAKWESIRNNIIVQASQEIPSRLSNLNLKIAGTALYWAEGYNASRNVFAFSNSNPDIIKIMMFFLRTICHVPEHKIKGKLNIHPHLHVEKAEKFWSQVTGITTKNFNKPLLAVSKSSKRKRDTLPFGTFNIIVCDVRVVSKIKGWIEGLKIGASSSAG
jgi:transposase-like protein